MKNNGSCIASFVCVTVHIEFYKKNCSTYFNVRNSYTLQFTIHPHRMEERKTFSSTPYNNMNYSTVLYRVPLEGNKISHTLMSTILCITVAKYTCLVFKWVRDWCKLRTRGNSDSFAIVKSEQWFSTSQHNIECSLH